MVFYKVTHKYKLSGHYERKHIGVYSSVEKAEKAVEILKSKKGFSETPSGFQIKKVVRISHPKLLDKTFWVDGFVTYTYLSSPKLSAKRYLHFSSNGVLVCNLVAFAVLFSSVRWWTLALALVFLTHLIVLPFDKRKSEWQWWSLVFMAAVSIAIPICYILVFENYYYFMILAVEILLSACVALFLKKHGILH